MVFHPQPIYFLEDDVDFETLSFQSLVTDPTDLAGSLNELVSPFPSVPELIIFDKQNFANGSLAYVTDPVVGDRVLQISKTPSNSSLQRGFRFISGKIEELGPANITSPPFQLGELVQIEFLIDATTPSTGPSFGFFDTYEDPQWLSFDIRPDQWCGAYYRYGCQSEP